MASKKKRKVSFTVAEFCRRNSISRTFFYTLRRKGLGPVEMRLLGEVRISRAEETAWISRMERRSRPRPAEVSDQAEAEESEASEDSEFAEKSEPSEGSDLERKRHRKRRSHRKEKSDW